MSFSGRRARKGFHPENVFPVALIVDFVRFYSAALDGVEFCWLTQKYWEVFAVYFGKDTDVRFVARHVSRERSWFHGEYLTACENFIRALVNLAELRTSRPLGVTSRILRHDLHTRTWKRLLEKFDSTFPRFDRASRQYHNPAWGERGRIKLAYFSSTGKYIIADTRDENNLQLFSFSHRDLAATDVPHSIH